MTTPPTPEDLAAQYGLPLQRALIDLDLSDPSQQVVGADPADLDGIPMEAVHSLMSAGAIITIMAHAGEGQTVANLLKARPEIKGMASSYGSSYLKEGVLDFAFRALTTQEVQNLERHTGKNLQDRPRA